MAVLKFYQKNVVGKVKVLIQNFLFHRIISQLPLKLAF